MRLYICVLELTFNACYYLYAHVRGLTSSLCYYLKELIKTSLVLACLHWGGGGWAKRFLLQIFSFQRHMNKLSILYGMKISVYTKKKTKNKQE